MSRVGDAIYLIHPHMDIYYYYLTSRTAYSYRLNFIDTAGGLSHVYANKVFCGWDFGVVSEQAAALTANSLYNEFKVPGLLCVMFTELLVQS